MRATIYDVAQRAGVSISTVSRVLNGTSPVKEAKRQLVLEAADALGYVPNPAALSLLNKRTGGLGVVLPFVSGEFFSELLSGLDTTAQELGYYLIISTSHSRAEEFQRTVRALDRRIDGLIVMAPELDVEGAASLLKSDTPVVFINTQTEGLDADAINFDNFAGARIVTDHLLEAGHQRIALIRGPIQTWDARERRRGYQSAMAEAGLDAFEVDGGFSREDGYAAAQEILELAPRPTAIVAANDYCAFGAMSALHDADVAVPGEVAVCGFDGLTSGQYSVPSLTTARVPLREVGSRAVRQLATRLDAVTRDSPPHVEVVPVELVVRGSTLAREASSA